jgi:hypothetical protein
MEERKEQNRRNEIYKQNAWLREIPRLGILTLRNFRLSP